MDPLDFGMAYRMDKRYRICNFFRQALLCSSIVLLSGCATQNNIDPIEPFNRTMFKLDRNINHYVLRPFVDLYDHLPNPVHKGVNNFFSNTLEPTRIVNALLQADVDDALNDLGRLIVNTSIGIGGLFDVATKLGMEKHQNDFGITLGKWGVRRSAYLYIPLLGPYTVRDTLSLGVDYFLLNPISYIDTDKIRLSLLALGKIHYEHKLLPAQPVIDDAFDPYVFVRDAYLQKRNAMINEVVEAHHAATDAFVYEHDDLDITAEDLAEAKAKNKSLNGDEEETTDATEESTQSDTEQATPADTLPEPQTRSIAPKSEPHAAESTAPQPTPAAQELQPESLPSS